MAGLCQAGLDRWPGRVRTNRRSFWRLGSGMSHAPEILGGTRPGRSEAGGGRRTRTFVVAFRTGIPVYVRGSFTELKGVAMPGLARLLPTDPWTPTSPVEGRRGCRSR